MKKRVVCLVLVAALLLGVLTGCTSPAPASPAEPAATTAPAAASTEPEATAAVFSPADAGDVTLRFAWWESDARHEATLAAISKYMELYPNVKIEGEYQGYDGYQQKLMTQFAGGTEPDLMQLDYYWNPQWVGQEDLFVDMANAPLLAFLVQLPAVGIGLALLNLARRWRIVLVVELLLAELLAFFGDRRVQLADIGFGRPRNGNLDLLVLIRQRLDMRAVGIQNLAADQPLFLRLIQDLLKDLFRDIVVAKPSLSIHTDRRMIRHLFRQTQSAEPAIGVVVLNLLAKPHLATNPIQIPDKEHAKQYLGIDGWPAVIRAIQRRAKIVDERKIDRRVDLSQQVIRPHQQIIRHQLQLHLFRFFAFQHVVSPCVFLLYNSTFAPLFLLVFSPFYKKIAHRLTLSMG